MAELWQNFDSRPVLTFRFGTHLLVHTGADLKARIHDVSNSGRWKGREMPTARVLNMRAE